MALLMPGFVSALYAADLKMRRLGRTPDLLVLAVRATKEALRGLRRSGVPPTPRALWVLEYLPEPVFAALVGWAMRHELAESSIEGHPRDARDDMTYLHQEFLSQLDRGRVKTEAMDQLARCYDEETLPVAEGRRDIPWERGLTTPLDIILGWRILRGMLDRSRSR